MLVFVTDVIAQFQGKLFRFFFRKYELPYNSKFMDFSIYKSNTNAGEVNSNYHQINAFLQDFKEGFFYAKMVYKGKKYTIFGNPQKYICTMRFQD